MSYLRYLYLFAYSGVQHMLCCVFVLSFFVLLLVSLDCPFFIAPSVFLTCIHYYHLLQFCLLHALLQFLSIGYCLLKLLFHYF